MKSDETRGRECALINKSLLDGRVALGTVPESFKHVALANSPAMRKCWFGR